MAKIAIGIPTHNHTVNASTVKTILSGASKDGHSVQYQIYGLSLLARCFNTLFCRAWEIGADYFIMLHADIAVRTRENAPAGWIDIMVRRIKQLEASVLSYASPIKSAEGHLSAGMLLHAGNPYSLRRLTLRQLHKLPVYAISRDHVCSVMGLDPNTSGAMLVNTGLMIMDLRNHPWCEWPGFEIKDRLVWGKKGPKGFTVPEDWNMSYWLHEHGWPYYLSRELHIDHFGSLAYTTEREWGADKDVTPIEPHPSDYV